MTKTYQLINATILRTCVVINGKIVSIRFAGGMYNGDGRIVRAGYYTTSDEKMQTAIEADSLYGRSFTVICADTVDKQSIIKTNDADRDVQFITGVTNTQLAIEWLRENKDVKFDGRPSKEIVRSAAIGVGVVFVDWK